MKKILFLTTLLISEVVSAAPWQYGIVAYDIEGNPYTGTAYVNEMVWMENTYENGRLMKSRADMCMQDQCEIKEFVNGIPYVRLREENGKPLDGMVKTMSQTDGGMTNGEQGLYVNGVPDGIHKMLDESGTVVAETMYDKGKTLWEKNYNKDSFAKADKTEVIYNDDMIINRAYKNGQKTEEKKTLPDGRLAEYSEYRNGKMAIRQRFRKNGTSQVEDFENGTKENLGVGKRYDGDFSQDFVVIAGRRAVCRGAIEESKLEYLFCHKNIDQPLFEAQAAAMNMSDAQKQLFYENPSEFFAKNELGLDLSDVGERNVRELNSDVEKIMGQAMEGMMAGMQGAMQGMVEGLGAESEDEFKEHVQKRINESVQKTMDNTDDS